MARVQAGREQPEQPARPLSNLQGLALQVGGARIKTCHYAKHLLFQASITTYTIEVIVNKKYFIIWKTTGVLWFFCTYVIRRIILKCLWLKTVPRMTHIYGEEEVRLSLLARIV